LAPLIELKKFQILLLDTRKEKTEWLLFPQR